MPRLSDTMTEGVVSRWLKTAGDRVAKGEPLVEVETEKATLEIASEADGYLIEISAAAGSEVPTGSRIGLVAPELRELSEPSTASVSTAEPAQPAPSVETARPAPPTPEEQPRPDDASSRLRVSPIAKKLARELGVDLGAIAVGRGPTGRIIRTDVERAAREGASVGESDAPAHPVSRRHAAMARRMTVAKQTIPHFYLSVEVDVTRLERLRDDLKRAPDHAPVSVTALVVKACAHALRRVPAVNGSWQDDTVRENPRVSIGVAVALESGELVVPVVAEPDVKTLIEINAELRRLAEKARRLELAEADVSGGTFTVSNMGMLGVDAAYAIVNPPESGILAVGAVRQTLRLVEMEVAAAQVMTVGLSGDHRVYSGATGAEFLRVLREYLENPIALFLDPGR